MSQYSRFVKQWTIFVVLVSIAGTVLGQSASFNFSNGSQPVTGWTNVSGDPSTAVRTATASSGITVSSVATANWYQNPGSNSCAFDGGGATGGIFFPAGVLLNQWYQFGTANASVLNVSVPQLLVSGLHADSIYTIRISGSFASGIPATYNLEPVQYTVMGATNYGSLNINGNYNTTDGAVFTSVIPDSTGSLRIYVNTANGSNTGSICGIQVLSGIAAGSSTAAGLAPGAGLAQLGQTLALGDSISGFGSHSFISNRYQYLNGKQYSFGGSVNNPVARPVLRLYDNGDIAASTTMDTSVNTDAQTGLRYYSKLGILQIGASDRLDTSVAVSSAPETWPGGGILVNSNSIDNANYLKSRLYDSYVQGNSFYLDTSATLAMVILNGQNTTIKNAYYDDDIFSGYGLGITAGIDNSIVTGNANTVSWPSSVNNISGFLNATMDTSRGSIVGGAANRYGGLWQTVCGVYLTNRTPGGVTLGSGNVDFSTLPYTGLQGFTTPGLAGYPLFVVGNASTYSVNQSNALTVLYNGRTQINTTGFGTVLTQAQVTPAAALDVVSANTGVLLPRLNTNQRNGILASDLQNGLLLYNTDSSVFQYYNGSVWNTVGSGSGTSHWQVSGSAIYDSLDNIGIGTSNTQGYKLAVNGPAIFTRVVVKPQVNWPDYVFDGNYRLPTLRDVERYIHEHHHLPGVASETEVKKNGVDLAEQQAALLKKVEELTLYMIDLDKRVDGLKQEHKRLLAKSHGQKTN